jgi:ferredoxin
MSMVITESCINCGNCEPDCPNDAIKPGDNIYVIDPERCTECVGALDTPSCVQLCPIPDCITIDPAHAESPEELLLRYKQLHVN